MKLTYVGFRAHFKIAPRIVLYRNMHIDAGYYYYVVCLSVCLSVWHTRERHKNERTDRDAVWAVDSWARGP